MTMVKSVTESRFYELCKIAESMLLSTDFATFTKDQIVYQLIQKEPKIYKMTHLQNLLIEVKTGNAFVYWYEKMSKLDRQRLASTLQVNFIWAEVLSVLNVICYSDNNNCSQEINELEYE